MCSELPKKNYSQHDLDYNITTVRTAHYYPIVFAHANSTPRLHSTKMYPRIHTCRSRNLWSEKPSGYFVRHFIFHVFFFCFKSLCYFKFWKLISDGISFITVKKMLSEVLVTVLAKSCLKYELNVLLWFYLIFMDVLKILY